MSSQNTLFQSKRYTLTEINTPEPHADKYQLTIDSQSTITFLQNAPKALVIDTATTNTSNTSELEIPHQAIRVLENNTNMRFEGEQTISLEPHSPAKSASTLADAM